ncbi:SusC/RagA family TonB-linked outer membrane protein [Xylanibacter oryzae]|uniref:SusC/RagA family TonB-linked outer membrane protein n=1 Tax=Xylanibacter oryzae TaxID=185293 RepID=UPI0004B32A30|nr:TonB-dependent receptor [Xylanibacter oryzae]
MKSAINALCKLCLIVLFLLLSSVVKAQTIIKGTVTDSSNEPIIGASVVEKGNPRNGTVTNMDGNFSLKLQKGKKYTVSYIGMVSQEITYDGTNKTIVLNEDQGSLDEIVVVGYTSKARKDLTGSVGSISGAKLAAVPVASAAEALQGKIAGVQVTSVDGAPGADINIRVRGGTSVTQSNQPLFIVDGFQTDNINDIPPTDIQSIDVLKDASLTAIYGAKGGNGVVVVTTKSAMIGKVKVDFNSYLQGKKLAGKVDMLDTYEFVRYQQDYTIGNNSRIYQFRNDFGNPNDLDLYRGAVTHDWQDEIMGGTPLTQMYNITVSGGSEKLRFNTSLTHHDEKGIIENSGVRLTNLNTKIDVQISPKLRLLFNPRFTYRRDLGAGADGIGTGGLIGVLKYRPTNGLREYMYRADKTVNYNDEKYWLLSSPQDDIDQNYQLKHSYTFTNQASLQWNIMKGMTFSTEIAQMCSFSDNNRYYGYLTSTGIQNNNMPIAQITNSRSNRYTWTNTLNYFFTVNDKHNLSFLLGHEMQSNQTTTNYQSSRYFPQSTGPRQAFNNMGLGTAWQSNSSVSTPNRMLSFFGQANYNYEHKYLLSATFRADGSTKFAPGKQWGYFPSISGAWVISSEPFMKNIKNISNLKLRLALGMAGNNNIDPDLWRYQYAISSTGGPSWGESTVNGTAYYTNGSGSVFPNTKIKWETTVTRNLAFDIGMFHDRLIITPEVYWNTTHDLLYKSLIPTTTGYSYQMQNVGQVTNRGFELTVNGNIMQNRDFNLSANFTMGFNKTRVDKLNGEDQQLWTTSGRWSSSNNDFCLQVGKEIGLIYGYVYDGLYSFDEFNRVGFNYEPKDGTVTSSLYGTYPGRPKFKDLSGPDGKPDGVVNEYDRTIIGNTNPRLQGGFGITGQWKNFDFTANFFYMLDFDVLNATAYDLSSAIGSSQTSPKNVLAKFSYDKRWVYYGDVYTTNVDGTQSLYNLGEPLLGNSQHIEYLDAYEKINAGKTLWNPNDITARYTTSYFVEDGSFLRLQDITIGYSLPKKITQKLGIERLRFYATGSNIFCLTSYSGYDPEVDIQSGLTPSVDYNRYPRSHSYLFGVNVTF